MIPVLRSIDSLLNRFDELSQRHVNLITDFNTNFTDIQNPLRDVARDEDEQRKTTEKLLAAANDENDDQIHSLGNVEEFNRRIIKSRSSNRPPSYSSTETNTLVIRVASRSSMATTESTSPMRNLSTVKMNNSSIVSTVVTNPIQPKVRPTTKTKPNIVVENFSLPSPYTRGKITTFTMETINRLSKPKSRQRKYEEKVSSKRVHRRKSREASEASITTIPSQPVSKRIHSTTTKSSSSSFKKLKTDYRYLSENSKRIPASNYPRPAIFIAQPPTISLIFPMQPEIQSSRVVVVPKPTTITKKPLNVLSNKRSIIPSNRMAYLMT